MKRMYIFRPHHTGTILLALLGLKASAAFVTKTFKQPSFSSLSVATSSPGQDELTTQKKRLLDLLRTDPQQDPVLADPITKEPVTIFTKSAMLAGNPGSRTNFELRSPSNTFTGSSDSFLNLLEPVSATNAASVDDDSDDATSGSSSNENINALARNLFPFIPPPLRSALATAGLPVGDSYIPMRDLFTSPSVSFAYERGWRQGFAAAGFPGPDKEAAMAMEYFESSMARNYTRTLVDMSCATGLFTRRFVKSGKYKRVFGCDYSASMLQEARRRIRIDPELNRQLVSQKMRLDLVRLDVGQIPMQTASIDALHAGAAMHCWPDLPAAVSEIHRVLKPGGRYFATTFLSSYFGTLQQAEGGATGPSRQAFQYFESVEQLRELLQGAGFARENILIEVLGRACVVIRCEKK